MSMKEVANIIDIQPGTVAFHKYRMMKTLNVQTNAELLEYAIKRHMRPEESYLLRPYTLFQSESQRGLTFGEPEG
jgi:hypothetical protein